MTLPKKIDKTIEALSKVRSARVKKNDKGR